MNLMNPNAAQPLTMSSREIAELCEKRHDKVKQSIDRLVERGMIAAPQIEEPTTPGGGKVKSVYRLRQCDTFVVVTQLSREFTSRLLDRWQELEAQIAKPAMLTGPQLMAAALIEARATLSARPPQFEAMREDVATHEHLIKADGSLTTTKAAKT